MARVSRVALVAVFALVAGCVTPGGAEKGSEMFEGMLPTGRPGLVGKYTFELLGQVQGHGCATLYDTTRYWTVVPGSDVGSGGTDMENQAEAAAVFDAMKKMPDADTLVPFRLMSEGTGDRVCVTIYGRGVRFHHLGQAPGAQPKAKPAGRAAHPSKAHARAGSRITPPPPPPPVSPN